MHEPVRDNLKDNRRSLAILGVRGVPAAHGGFETFAARLAPHLARDNWCVRVYCQEARDTMSTPESRPIWQTTWEGVTRIHIAVPSDTAVNSIRFDWMCISHVLKARPDAVLILGYNTAVFAARLRLAGIPTVMNMDGMEWKRAKWGPLEKTWLYVNERAGCRLAHHLVADHPQIGLHLQKRSVASKITVIPYGAELIGAGEDEDILSQYGVRSKQFATVIARAEPENSILEMIRAFSAKRRNIQLLVLGYYYPRKVEYHASVMRAASSEVTFPGAIFDRPVVAALRRHSLFYMHGHQVGGCNPSLLEAMGAGNAVLAHDNRFNRWVVGRGALFFSDAASCERALDEVMLPSFQLDRYGDLNRQRAREVFAWNEVLASYTELLDAASSGFAAQSESGWGRRAQWSLDSPS
jgi:glycosyltransferase involved in cell wall biosynthesis